MNPQKTPRIRIPAEVKQYLLDRNNHHCQSCGKTTHQAELTIDHIIPLAHGGTNDLSNLQILCRSCNSRKQHQFDPRFDRPFDL